MKKHFLTIVVALVLSTLSIGCGGGSTSSTKNSSSNSTVVSNPIVLGTRHNVFGVRIEMNDYPTDDQLDSVGVIFDNGSLVSGTVTALENNIVFTPTVPFLRDTLYHLRIEQGTSYTVTDIPFTEESFQGDHTFFAGADRNLVVFMIDKPWNSELDAASLNANSIRVKNVAAGTYLNLTEIQVFQLNGQNGFPNNGYSQVNVSTQETISPGMYVIEITTGVQDIEGNPAVFPDTPVIGDVAYSISFLVQ